MGSSGVTNFLEKRIWSIFGEIVRFFKICYMQWNITRVLSKFDGPKCSSFFLGNWDILVQPIDGFYKSLRALAKEYYPHYRLRLLHRSALNILSPEDCEIFMGTRKHSSKSDMYLLLFEFMRDGLIMSKGEKWMRRRKLLTPAFHFNILKDFLNVFNEQTEVFIENISNISSQPINVVPLVTDFTLYTLNETAMGIKLDGKSKIQRGYRDAVCEIGEVLLYRLMRPWLYTPWMYSLTSTFKREQELLKTTRTFTRNIINKRMAEFKGISEFGQNDEEKDKENEIYMTKRKKVRLAMLDILLQAKQDGERIGYKGICEEVDTFMFAGHDTTTAAISFCLMLLANHPEIQDKIYEEINTVLLDVNEKPSYSDLQKMELLERCIKETLRLYPSVPVISRYADEDTVLNSGLLVPKKSLINIQILDVHRNPDIYPNPDKFDPDRFLPENCKNRHPYAYIPFSAGPRNCIGQKFAMLEIKTLIIGILRQFKLNPVDTPESIIMTNDMILRAKNGIKIKFDPRN